MNPNETNPYKPTPVDQTPIVSSSTPDNLPIRTPHTPMVFTLAFLGGTAALIGLVLGICSVTLIASTYGFFARASYFAFLAIPIGAITLFVSCMLLAFGIKAVRDAYLQLRE